MKKVIVFIVIVVALFFYFNQTEVVNSPMEDGLYLKYKVTVKDNGNKMDQIQIMKFKKRKNGNFEYIPEEIIKINNEKKEKKDRSGYYVKKNFTHAKGSNEGVKISGQVGGIIWINPEKLKNKEVEAKEFEILGETKKYGYNVYKLRYIDKIVYYEKKTGLLILCIDNEYQNRLIESNVNGL